MTFKYSIIANRSVFFIISFKHFRFIATHNTFNRKQNFQ